jgi:hypothetical protein
LTVPTYYRLRAMTVDGNGRSALTHFDIPLSQDGPKGDVSVKQAESVPHLCVIECNPHACNAQTRQPAHLFLVLS